MRGLAGLPASSGVYMIRFVLDKRHYVGSSVNVRKRVQNHLSDLRKGGHHSPHMQRAWSKYGEKFFEVFLISVRQRNVLQATEQMFLDTLTGHFNGSRTAYRVEHSESVRQKMSEKSRAAWQRPGYREMMSEKRRGQRTALGRKASAATVAKLKAVHRDRNRRYEAFGRLWSLKELAEEYGVKYTMLKDRVRAGWDLERAVLSPKRAGGL